MTSANSTEAAAAAPARTWASRLLAKPVVIPVLVLPALWPLWPLFVSHDRTVATDPGKYVLHHLGFTAAVLVVVVLSFSPLHTLFPRSAWTRALQRLRRTVGVTAFVYAALHVTMHFIYEGGFGTFAADWKKPFITLGLIALLILAALAATSFNTAIRWLGSRRWKHLHRLVYVAVVLIAYHQILARKIFPQQVVWLFGPLLGLEILRIGRNRWRRRA